MGYMVADTHNLFPGNFASDRKWLMICLLVNFLYAFTDSLKEHTAGSQCLHAFGRLKVAISSFNAIVPLSKGVNGTDYLLKLVLDNFNCW